MNEDHKYIDFEIDQSGQYIFYVSLYSPHYSDSNLGGEEGGEGLGSPYIVEVSKDNIKVQIPPYDDYPYPHRNIYEDLEPEMLYQYLMTENGFILSTEDNENITL